MLSVVQRNATQCNASNGHLQIAAGDGPGVRQSAGAMLASILRTRANITDQAGTLGLDERRSAAHRYSEISAALVHFLCR